MKAMLLTLTLLMPLSAQFPTPNAQARIFDIKYGDVRKIGEMIRIFPHEGLNWDDSMRTISVRTSPEAMKMIEETIKRFDVPTASQNLEFTVYMVIASADPAKAGPVPATLDPVLKQMGQTFSFKAFRLAETFMLRTRDGKQAKASSIGPVRGIDNQQIFYQCKLGSARVIPDEKGKNIRIDGLRIGMRTPYKVSGGPDPKYQFADIGFSTDIDVREGQKAVVGKANLNGEETMFAILVPRIVD